MRTLDTTHSVPLKESSVRWARVLVAAFCSELGVILAISAIMVIHRFVIAPGLTADQYGKFEQQASYFVAAPAAAISTFACAWYTIRRLKSGFVINGVLVGTVATVLTLGFIAGARPEDRLMYLVSYGVRIIAGYAAGLMVRKKGSLA
jgi:hypothetical protein